MILYSHFVYILSYPEESVAIQGLFEADVVVWTPKVSLKIKENLVLNDISSFIKYTTELYLRVYRQLL